MNVARPLAKFREQTRKTEQNTLKIGMVWREKNAHSEYELTMNGERAKRGSLFSLLHKYHERMCTMVNIATGFLLNGIYVFFSVFYLRRKAIYLTHFVSAGVVWQNEIRRPTRRVCRCERHHCCCCFCCKRVCLCALVCGNKIELQHILNINTHSVHCTLRRLTLLSDKKTIKHVCLLRSDELLPFFLFQKMSLLHLPKWFSFLLSELHRRYFFFAFLSSRRIFVVCQKFSVRNKECREQNALEMVQQEDFGTDGGKCRIDLMVCNWVWLKILRKRNEFATHMNHTR